jgi:hypothetical protein
MIGKPRTERRKKFEKNVNKPEITPEMAEQIDKTGISSLG